MTLLGFAGLGYAGYGWASKKYTGVNLQHEGEVQRRSAFYLRRYFALRFWLARLG